ncbi:MAG: glutamine--fructose-6-phosphate transaminase (isomerizing) [Candidatus Dojkabacteria bacterium]
MCGIYGYAGDNAAGLKVVEGLKRLEYRGYDSWGVAVNTGNEIHIKKRVGAIGDFKKHSRFPNASAGIGHTRWATHGGVTVTNAHPRKAKSGEFVIAHNGIVQNYNKLKGQLERDGYTFESETDTEVILGLIETAMDYGMDIRSALRAAFGKIEGRNTTILLTSKGDIYAIRNGSPLVVGLTKDGEVYFSSDTLSFAGLVEDIIVIENGQMVSFVDEKLSLSALKNGQDLKVKTQKLGIKTGKIDKDGYEHFMLKEINETPEVLRQVIDTDKSKLEQLAAQIRGAEDVYTIGSGTAGIAAAQIAYFIRKHSGVEAVSLVGADATEYLDLMSSEDVLIAPSQSGETADVLEVLEITQQKGVKIATYVNMPGSTMTRIADFPFMANAGPEICVMSTKVFTSQIAWGYLLAKTIADEYEDGIANLRKLVENASEFLGSKKASSAINKLSGQFASKNDLLLLGKADNYQIVKEGMVKLIEGSYKHAHAIPAGDLKHYAITLIEDGVDVILILPDGEHNSDIYNAASEVKARGATVTVLANKRYPEFDSTLIVPDCGEVSSIMNILPLQLLAYYLTVRLGNNVDKPRNIAKSVTVK